MSKHGSLTENLPADDLHLCRTCLRPFVVPISILPLSTRDGYAVELQCTNCGASAVGVHGDDELDRLDRELDRQAGQLRHALQALALVHELDEADRFAAALAADLILPEDF